MTGCSCEDGLSALGYEEWLHREAVSYVALPDVQLDPSSAREGRLIEAGLPYLREVFSSAHWRIYASPGRDAGGKWAGTADEAGP